MLAQGLGHLDAGLGQLGFQQFLQHRHAGTALGSGAGAALEFAEFLDRRIPLTRSAAVNGVPDGPGGDVIAGAEGGVVGEFGFGSFSAACRGEESAGLCGKFPAQERTQAHVR
nr:hypothetical protein [Arthrobacter sp. FW306-05-C]